MPGPASSAPNLWLPAPTHFSPPPALPPAPQVATKEKNAAQERMAEVQAKLDKMQAEFDAAMAQKQVRAPGGAPAAAAPSGCAQHRLLLGPEAGCTGPLVNA
jgi:hypothetical protein